MKDFATYTIEISNLKNQDYEYDFLVKDNFFQLFPQSLIEQGNLTVKVLLRKSETMLQLHFKITGFIVLTCDRSLENFDFPIKSEAKLILKFGASNEVINDDLEIISRDTIAINVAQYIYEYIALEVPMKKLHPKFQDDSDDDEDVLIYSSEDKSVEEQTNEEEIDPRWQALKKLKD